MGRSEMGRVKRKLIDNCVFINKKIEISQGAIRCQVHEMWGQVILLAIIKISNFKKEWCF